MNRQVEYTVFSDEGHGNRRFYFTKKKNEFATYKQVIEFLTKHLLMTA